MRSPGRGAKRGLCAALAQEKAAEASGAALAAASRSRAGLFARRKLVPMPPEPLPDKLYIIINGTGVPVTSKEAAGREGKGEDGQRARRPKTAATSSIARAEACGRNGRR